MITLYKGDWDQYCSVCEDAGYCRSTQGGKEFKKKAIFIIYDSLFAPLDSKLVLQECLKVKKGKVLITPFSFPFGIL